MGFVILRERRRVISPRILPPDYGHGARLWPQRTNPHHAQKATLQALRRRIRSISRSLETPCSDIRNLWKEYGLAGVVDKMFCLTLTNARLVVLVW